VKSVRDSVYELLRKQGITTVFGNPGSNELPFLSAFPADFRYVLALHEGVAVGIADGFAQASGRAALVNLHAAAGTGNAMGALANACAAHSPLIITAGQQVRSTIGLEPLLTNVDAGQLPRPLVKWSYEPASAQDVPRAFSQAIHLAALPPRGPTYLSIPYDDWDSPAPSESELLAERKVSGETVPSREIIDHWLTRLARARDPVMVLGADVDAAGANSAAVTISEVQRLPVWIAPSPSRCPFPTTHPHFRGVLPAGNASIARLLSQHDLILVVGAPVFRYHENEPGTFLPKGATLLHLTCDPQEGTRAPLGEAAVADIGSTLKALSEAAKPSQRPAPLPKARIAPAPQESGPLSPEAVFDLIAEVAPSDAIYVNESTSTTNAMWERLPMNEPGSYFFPAAGGLGFGIPAALGVQLTHPNRRVIGVIGDGSANYAITGLWTAAQHQIPAIFIILKNGVYGALRWFSHVLQAKDVPGLDIPGLDFCALATGYGVSAVHADNIDALRGALTRALAERRPILIEVPTRPNT
jgi:benzoylformate decarboxylase